MCVHFKTKDSEKWGRVHVGEGEGMGGWRTIDLL